MPKAAKRNPTGRTKTDRIPVSSQANKRAEELARKLGSINPRTGDGNRSDLVERAIASLYKHYPYCIPLQNQLMLWLLELCDRPDIPEDVKQQATTWADYLESWGIEQNLEEEIGEKVIKVGDSYIM